MGGGDWAAIPYVGPYFFSKVLPKFEFKVNFSIESCASLTREDPAYLQIPYQGVNQKFWEDDIVEELGKK